MSMLKKKRKHEEGKYHMVFLWKRKGKEEEGMLKKAKKKTYGMLSLNILYEEERRRRRRKISISSIMKIQINQSKIEEEGRENMYITTYMYLST